MTGPARTSPASPRACYRAASVALVALLALAACTDRDPVSARPRDARAALLDERGDSRLVVGIDDPNIRMLSVEIGGPDLEAPLSWKFERKEDGPLYGTIAVPASEERSVVLRGFDGEGREVFVGESPVAVDKQLTPQVRFDLKPVGEAAEQSGGTQGWIGSYRIAAEPLTLGEPSEEPVKLMVTVRDPDGVAMPIEIEDIDWEWPREVLELEIVHDDREAREIVLARFQWIDPNRELKAVVTACSNQFKACVRIPRPPFTFPIYTKVVGGGTHTCALNRWSTVKCWGGNGSGQLGIDAAGTDHVAPHAFVDVSAGFEHTCAIDTQGQAWCWGSNAYAQSGFQGYYPANVATPVQVKNAPPAFTQIAAGGRHTCALSTTGEIWCWGEWRYGQLGDGQFYQSSAGYDQKPHKVDSYQVFVAVSAGESHSCGVTSTGQVWCWGLNSRGQTGGVWQTNHGVMDAYHCQLYASATLYDCNRRPNQVQSIPGGATKIASGGHRNCALNGSGEMWCWGAFALGGNSPTPDNLYPVLVVANGGSVHFTAVGVGTTQSCGVATDSAVWCWGYGGSGQLGNGTNSYVATVPVQASGQLPLATSLGLGGTHSCAINASRNGILCWGLGSSGQLGTGGFASANVPTAVTAF